MLRDKILANEKRRCIYDLIGENPGIHLREVQRLLSILLATLDYHLSFLVRKQIVFGETQGHIKGYYTHPLDVEDKKMLLVLRQEKLREIVIVALSKKKAKHQELSDCLKLPHSTLSFHTKMLVTKGILAKEKVGHEIMYTVREEDRVAKVIAAHKWGFLDMLVDKAISAWFDAYVNDEKK